MFNCATPVQGLTLERTPGKTANGGVDKTEIKVQAVRIRSKRKPDATPAYLIKGLKLTVKP